LQLFVEELFNCYPWLLVLQRVSIGTRAWRALRALLRKLCGSE